MFSWKIITRCLIGVAAVALAAFDLAAAWSPGAAITPVGATARLVARITAAIQRMCFRIRKSPSIFEVFRAHIYTPATQNRGRLVRVTGLRSRTRAIPICEDCYC